MRGEGPGPIERPHNSEEEGFNNEHEQRFARFVSAHKEADSILDVLSELDDRLLPDSVKRRLAETVRELERIGHDALAPGLSDERRDEIERDVEPHEGEAKSELEEVRVGIRKDRDIAELHRNVALMQASWKEAYGRLRDSNVIRFTSETRSTTAVEQYLADNRATLTPEETFFLQATIGLRKAKDALAAVEGERA